MKTIFKTIFVLLLVAGLGDCLSTAYGLSLPPKIVGYEYTYNNNGVQGSPVFQSFFESRSFYFPFLGTLLLSVAAFAVLFMGSKSTRKVQRRGLMVAYVLAAFSFSGVVNNVLLLSGVADLHFFF